MFFISTIFKLSDSINIIFGNDGLELFFFLQRSRGDEESSSDDDYVPYIPNKQRKKIQVNIQKSYTLQSTKQIWKFIKVNLIKSLIMLKDCRQAPSSPEINSTERTII